MGTGFPSDKREAFARRSCSNKKIERDDDSKKSHPALSANPAFAAEAQRSFPQRPAAHTSIRRKATPPGKRSAQDGLSLGPKSFAEMDFSNDLPTEAGIDLLGVV